MSPSLPSDLAGLLAVHRTGNFDAFGAIVCQAERTWWYMAAAVAGSQRQMEALVRCSVVAMRKSIDTCPTETTAFHAWAREIGRQQGMVLFERAARPDSDGEDDLSRLVAAAGLEDLREDGPAVADGAISVANRLSQLEGADRTLISNRYRHGRQLAAVASEMGQDPEALARHLCRLRYALDWRPDATPEILANDAGFCRTIEDALADRIGSPLRQRLIYHHAAGDDQRLALVIRQLRLHLVLETACTPIDPQRSQRLAATVAYGPETAYPEGNREANPIRQLSQQISIRPGGVQRRKPISDRMRAISSPRPAGSAATASSRLQSASETAKTRVASEGHDPVKTRTGGRRTGTRPPVSTGTRSPGTARSRPTPAPAPTADDRNQHPTTDIRTTHSLKTYLRNERINNLLMLGAVVVMAVIALTVIWKFSP